MENTIAAFLLIRGPHAWLGWSWVSCSGDCFTTIDKCPKPPGHQVVYDTHLGGLADKDFGVPRCDSWHSSPPCKIC